MNQHEAMTFQPGDHVCIMGDNIEIEPLVMDGLAENELCCYIGEDQAEIDRITKSSSTDSIFLSLDSFLGKKVDPQRMIDTLKDLITQAETQGFPRLRVIQDMGHITQKIPHQEYTAYEARINLLCSEYDMVCICLYGRTSPAEVICGALETHPLVVIDDELCENFYYVSPELFLEGGGYAAEGYLKNVLEFHQLKEKVEKEEENLKFLAGVVENVMEAVVITDEKGKITYVNPAACTVFGYTKEDLRGEMISILNSGNSRAAFQEVLRNSHRKGWEGEILAIRKSGQKFPLWLRISALQDEKGEVTAMVSVSRDISDQKEAEEKLQRYALLLEMKVREKTRSTETLLKTSYALRSTSNWKKGTEIITRGIVEGLGFDRAAIFFLNEHEQVLECGGQLNMSKKVLKVKVPLTDDRYAVVKSVKEKRPLLVKDARTDPRVEAHLEEEAGEFVWVPILFQSEVLGAIGADRKSRKTRIEEEDVDMLVLYANQIAEFMERTRLVVEPEVEKQVSTPLKYDLNLQEVYLIEEERSEKAYDMFADLVKHKFKGFGICRTHPQKIRETYGLKRTPMMWLSEIERKQVEQVGPQDIPKLIYLVAEFIKRAQPAVVILEGMEYLIVQNDFETVLKLLHTFSDYVTTSQSILLVPVNPDALPHHQYVMLRRAFNVITESE